EPTRELGGQRAARAEAAAHGLAEEGTEALCVLGVAAVAAGAAEIGLPVRAHAYGAVGSDRQPVPGPESEDVLVERRVLLGVVGGEEERDLEARRAPRDTRVGEEGVHLRRA